MKEVFSIDKTTMTIHLPAELDHCTAEEIGRWADRMIRGRNIRCILFDFEKTVFMDSSGVGMLIRWYKTMRFMGGTVLAVRANERIRRILVLSGIDKLIDIYEGLPREAGLL